MFERYYSFSYCCLFSCRYAMFRKRILSKPIWITQAVVKGGTAPWPSRSDGTAAKIRNQHQQLITCKTSKWHSLLFLKTSIFELAYHQKLNENNILNTFAFENCRKFANHC